SKVVNISQHLKRTHRVANTDERKILIDLARGNINLLNLPCPLCQRVTQRVYQHFKKAHKNLTVICVVF
ncbi:MAG: hypothetical protein ACRDDA_10735, partial [Aeromonas sp.]